MHKALSVIVMCINDIAIVKHSKRVQYFLPLLTPQGRNTSVKTFLALVLPTENMFADDSNILSDGTLKMDNTK